MATPPDVAKLRRVVHRNREEGHDRLFNDYFLENHVYTDIQFRRRFHTLNNHDEYFQMRVDALRSKGLSPLQKCTTAIRILAYGPPIDNMDEYVRIGETTTVECLERFVSGMRPNNEDTKKLLQMGVARGFPNMLGSIDCMHWEWKNCLVAWKDQFC
ncbi:hypothetical protein GmHk_14G041886 [Glycine max]|nr:hypothetical protein GmHk_14G041886 [Glycine max]